MTRQNMILKETLRKSFQDTLNGLIGEIKKDMHSPNTEDLADFAVDYAKEVGSLLFCYEFIEEKEYDVVVKQTSDILKMVKTNLKNAR